MKNPSQNETFLILHFELGLHFISEYNLRTDCPVVYRYLSEVKKASHAHFCKSLGIFLISSFV